MPSDDAPQEPHRGHAVEKLLGQAAEKIRGILLQLEEQLEDPALRKILEAKNYLPTVKLRLENCTYVIVRVPEIERASLSPRQRDIARLFVEGLPRRKIASALQISPRTVDTHIERLFVKFGVDTRIALARKITLLS